MKAQNFIPFVITALTIVWMLPGCSHYSRLNEASAFNGITSSHKMTFQVPLSGIRSESRTPDIGVVMIEVAPNSFATAQDAELRATQDKELDEVFQTNPASAALQRYPGEFHVILGNQPPKNDLWFCFNQQQVAKESTDFVPLIYWTYDGENEVLPYFEEPLSRVAPGTQRKCLQLEAGKFGSLNNAEGRFEIVVLFGKKVANPS